MTVIADYRLVPEVKFPEPVEDIRDAIAWFLSNTAAVAAAGTLPSGAQLDRIVVMGHSAGSNHVSTLFLSEDVLPLSSPVRAATRGLVPKGGAFKFAFGGPPMLPGNVLEEYYGSQEATLLKMPTALVAGASEALIKSLPDVFVLRSEREPATIQAACDDFVRDLETRRGGKIRYDIMQGHNHISPHTALMTGEGEQWAETVAEWVKITVN